MSVPRKPRLHARGHDDLLLWVSTVAATIAVAFFIGSRGYGIYDASDGEHYIDIARGLKNVQLPFASRQLGPLVAQAIAHILGTSVLHGFLVQAIVSMVVLATTVYALLKQSHAPRWLLLAFLPLPFWGMLASGIVLPDLWFASQIALLCWFLHRRMNMAASLMFLAMMLSRETTLLVLLWFLYTVLRNRLGWIPAITSTGCSVAGLLIVKRLTAASPGNQEHLPEILYIFGKIPWNFTRYVLGVLPWSNVYQGLCSVPLYQTPLHLGPITAIGTCGFDWTMPFFLVDRVLRVFGLLPLLLIYVWHRRTSSAHTKPFVTFSLLYGSFSFVIGPTLGTGLDRLSAYGWPAFLIALPQLLGEVPQLRLQSATQRSFGFLFLFLHGLSIADGYWSNYVASALLQVVLYLLGWRILQLWWRDAEVDPRNLSVLAQQPTNA